MTLRALARHLGVSATTVSLALKGNPRISNALRTRIVEAARTAGYIPNAQISELMNQVRSSRVPAFRACLGAFSLFPYHHPWQDKSYHHLEILMNAARECAQSHGYLLELLWLQAPGMTPARFRSILEARNIRGLICLGSLSPDEKLPPELDNFTIVGFAASVDARINRVASHFAQDCRTLLNQLLARGYQRPGLILKSSSDRRTDYGYSSTYLGVQERKLSGPQPKIFRAETWDEIAFAQWFAAAQPDALVLHHEPDFIAHIEAFLLRQKLRVPQDLGLALLDKNPNPLKFSGILQNIQQMGIEAVELLISRLNLHPDGKNEVVKHELLAGQWNEATTLRPVS